MLTFIIDVIIHDIDWIDDNESLTLVARRFHDVDDVISMSRRARVARAVDCVCFDKFSFVALSDAWTNTYFLAIVVMWILFLVLLSLLLQIYEAS